MEKEQVQAAPPAPITFIFRGLMVSHLNATLGYEVGILPSVDHEFTINIVKRAPDGTWHQHITPGSLPRREIWNLAIASSSTRIYRDLSGAGSFNRMSNTFPQDSRWAIGINELHGPRVDIEPGLLNPILRLDKGRFHTKQKANSVQIKRGGGLFEPFGGVAEIMAIEVMDFQAGDHAVLRVQSTGREIFRLKREMGTTYEVFFDNTPSHNMPVMPGQPSHFQLYYLLFGVTVPHRVEFKGPADRVPNPFLCGKVFISQDIPSGLP